MKFSRQIIPFLNFKIPLSLFLLFILTGCITSQSTPKQNKEVQVYLDSKGNVITPQDYRQRWGDKENDLVRFDYWAKDTGRVATLVRPIYSQYQVEYPDFSKKMEEITGKQFSEKTIFLLEYQYLEDICGKYTNEWPKRTITERKKFTTPNKREIEKIHPDVVVLNFFEEGISLSNNPGSKNEYFFIDKDNFLRKIFFRNRSSCGSFALIKPNGQTLVRNGESYTKYMAEHLNPETWNQFFPPSE